MDSFDILQILKKRYKVDLAYKKDAFKRFISCILISQSKDEKVDLSIKNLENFGILSLDKIANEDEIILQKLINPSGYCQKKAKVLKFTCKNILNDFIDFTDFILHVKRDWLLNQANISFQTADMILNFTCKKDIFVIDNNIKKLLQNLDFCFENYEQMQEWITQGLDQRVYNIYLEDVKLCEIYERFYLKVKMFFNDKERSFDIFNKF